MIVPLQNVTPVNGVMVRTFHTMVGGIVSAIGFLSSSIQSALADTVPIRQRWEEPVRALQTFLTTTGIDRELVPSWGEKTQNHDPRHRFLYSNLWLLQRIQQQIQFQEQEQCEQPQPPKDHDPQRTMFHGNRTEVRYKPTLLSFPSKNKTIPTLEESRRYMRYATAVYGQEMIHAANIDARGSITSWNGKLQQVTRNQISQHIDVPADDIVLMDVDFDGPTQHLRHFVAVDHRHSKIVLSIRGTFSLQDVMVDVAAFSSK